MPLRVPPGLEPHLLLGADDPEMRRIGELVQAHGLPHSLAYHGGSRVDGYTAYHADPSDQLMDLRVFPVFVESEVPGIVVPGRRPFGRIDHHRPGDPGYECSTSDAVSASSLGQLALFLGIKLPYQDRVLAATDHHFAAAAASRVPGINGRDVMLQRIGEIAGNAGSSAEQTVLKIRAYQGTLLCCGTLNLNEALTVIDATEVPLGLANSTDYLCMQVALVALEKAGVIKTRNTATGPDKFILCGSTTEDQVYAFMENWAKKMGLTDIYGVPLRGYAGGYRLTSSQN